MNVSDATPQPARFVAGHFTDGICLDTWREAGTRDWLLMVTTAGRGRVGYPGGDVFLGPREVVVLRPGARHDYGSERLGRRWEFYWAHFMPPPEWLLWLDWPEAAPDVLKLRIREQRAWTAVREVCVKMLRRGARAGRHADALAANALEELLVRLDLVRVRATAEEGDERIRKAKDFLAANLGRTVTLGELAAHCGLSPARLSRAFHAATGRPPMRYLEELRMSRAARLLTLAQDKVENIARQVGFANPFYFTLRFKRHTGMSPTAYRAERRSVREARSAKRGQARGGADSGR